MTKKTPECKHELNTFCTCHRAGMMVDVNCPIHGLGPSRICVKCHTKIPVEEYEALLVEGKDRGPHP